MLPTSTPASTCWTFSTATTCCWSICRPWGDTCCSARETSSDTWWTCSSERPHSLKYSVLSSSSLWAILANKECSACFCRQAGAGASCHHSVPTQPDGYLGDGRQSHKRAVWQRWNSQKAGCAPPGGNMRYCMCFWQGFHPLPLLLTSPLSAPGVSWWYRLGRLQSGLPRRRTHCYGNTQFQFSTLFSWVLLCIFTEVSVLSFRCLQGSAWATTCGCLTSCGGPRGWSTRWPTSGRDRCATQSCSKPCRVIWHCCHTKDFDNKLRMCKSPRKKRF